MFTVKRLVVTLVVKKSACLCRRHKANCSLWDRQELDTTEQQYTHTQYFQGAEKNTGIFSSLPVFSIMSICSLVLTQEKKLCKYVVIHNWDDHLNRRNDKKETLACFYNLTASMPICRIIYHNNRRVGIPRVCTPHMTKEKYRCFYLCSGKNQRFDGFFFAETWVKE